MTGHIETVLIGEEKVQDDYIRLKLSLEPQWEVLVKLRSKKMGWIGLITIGTITVMVSVWGFTVAKAGIPRPFTRENPPGRVGEMLILPADEGPDRLGSQLGQAHRDETKKMINSVHRTGFVEIPDKHVLRLARLREDKKDFFQLPFAELKKRASFALMEPKWLPDAAKYAGALRAGIPNEWRSISMYYEYQGGEFYVGQLDLSNGGVIVPAEFVTEKVREIPAYFLEQRVQETGEIVRLLSWANNGVAYSVEGNLTKEDLMRIAESLEP